MPNVVDIAKKYELRFANIHGEFMRIPGMKSLPNNSKLKMIVNEFGRAVAMFNQDIGSLSAATASNLQNLAKMANAADELQEYDVADFLDGLAGNLAMKNDSFKGLIALANELDELGHHDLADKLDGLIGESNKNLEIVNQLVDIADQLDVRQDHQLADVFERTAGLVKTANDYSFLLNYADDLEEEKPVVVPGEKRTLSTRYCPDHRGVQAIRIAENTYQCPLDGSVYNYEAGYQDYRGQVVPGGSIAKQTPDTSNYGIPMRFYDSRQTVLRSVT